MVYIIDPTHVDHAGLKEAGKKKSWKQYLLIFIALLPFTTNAIQYRYLKTLDLTWNTDTGPWFETLYLTTSLIFGPIFCCFADRSGRKFLGYIFGLIQIISWIPILFYRNFVCTLTSFLLLGVSTGGIYTIIPLYLIEISKQRTRGITIVLLMVMRNVGDLITELIINYGNETVMKYLVLSLLAVQFLLSFMLIESPSYLVMKGRVKEASANYSKLLCLQEDSAQITCKIDDLTKELEKANCKDTGSVYKILKNEIWRDGFKICMVLFTVLPLGGSQVFMDHVRILTKPRVDFDPQLWSIGVPALMLACSLITVAVVDLWERRYNLCLSLSLMSFFLGILGVFMQEDMEPTLVPWAPMVCLLLVVAAYGMMWGVPILMANEIFTFKVRATLIGVIYAYTKFIELIFILTLPYIENYIGTHLLIYIFSAVNIYGAIYSYFRIPDLKNKSTKQIERQLKRIPII